MSNRRKRATNATFKKAVLSLRVVPEILQNKRVVLTLSVNQDKPGLATAQGLVIKTQHMQTQVVVKNKQTIIVGGIYDG